MLRALSLLLLLCLLSGFIIQSVHSSPPTKDNVSSKPKRRGPRKWTNEKKLPDYVDVNSISLDDLVDMRPTKLNTDEGLRYKYYFANHPRVMKINLQDKEVIKPVEQLLALSSSRYDQDYGWKRKLTASVRNLIDDSPHLDSVQKDKMNELVASMRDKVIKRKSVDKYRSKIGVEALKSQREKAQAEYINRRGHSYGANRDKIKKESPHLNLPLKHYLKEPMSAWDAEIATRQLGKYYASPGALTKALTKYLKEMKVPPKDIAAVLAIRSFTIVRDARILRREKGRGNESEAAQSGKQFTAVDSLDHSGSLSPILRSFQYALHPSPQASLHPATMEDESSHFADWQWLHNTFHDDEPDVTHTRENTLEQGQSSKSGPVAKEGEQSSRQNEAKSGVTTGPRSSGKKKAANTIDVQPPKRTRMTTLSRDGPTLNAVRAMHRQASPYRPINGESNTSTSIEKQHRPPESRDVNQLECGSWWESGCFDD